MSRTVLIVDDHAGFRRLARRVLEVGGLTVIGEAQDGASALAALSVLAPDVVLVDVVLPGEDGFAVAAAIARAAPRSRIVLTSSREIDDLRTRLARTPACGFLPKAELSAEAVAAVVEAAR